MTDEPLQSFLDQLVRQRELTINFCLREPAYDAWAIGGRHDRPFPPHKPILGFIRPMSARGMARTFDTAQYIQNVEAATGAPVPGALPAR